MRQVTEDFSAKKNQVSAVIVVYLHGYTISIRAHVKHLL